MRWAVAFPDAQLEVTTVRADSGGAVMEFVGRGTHRGRLITPTGTVAATGRRGEARYCFVYDVEDGRVQRIRQYWDVGTLMRRLDVGR
jgi:ketosteroid isomerase-like protein